MSSSSENKYFRQLENCLNIIFESASEDKIMNTRSKLGILLIFCCVNDPIKTLNIITQKMEDCQPAPNTSIILLSCLCYTFQYIPNFRSSNHFSKFTAGVENLWFRHAVFDDSNNMHNLSLFFQAGGAKLLPCPEKFLFNLLVNYEQISPPLVSKPIGYLIDINPESNSSIFWKIFESQTVPTQNIFLIKETSMQLISKISSSSNLMPPNDKTQLNFLIQACEQNCKIISSKGNEKMLNNNSDKPFKFHQVEISLTILRWLISHKLYSPKRLVGGYNCTAIDCLVLECWSEYAKYCDLKELPEFTIADTAMNGIYLKIIHNSMMNPTFSFDLISVNHWLWHEILSEFSREKTLSDQISYESPLAKKTHSLYDLSSNELITCAEIASILPQWFFIHCFRFKCRNSENSARVLKIMSELPSSILINNFDDFIDFIMYHLTSFPQNAKLIADLVRDLISVLLPRINPLIAAIVNSIDYYEESNLTPRLIILNTIFCFGVETESFTDVLDNIIESIPLFEGNLSLSFCSALFEFLSLMTVYVQTYNEILFNISMAVICATYSSCSIMGNANKSANINTSGSGLLLKRTMSAGNFNRLIPNGFSNLSPLTPNSNESTNHDSLSKSYSITDRGFGKKQQFNNVTDSILMNQTESKDNNIGLIQSNSSTLLINSGTTNVGGVDFHVIDEPSFVRLCEQSHAIYLSCMRFYSVISSDIVINPNYKLSESFPLTPLAFILIQKLPSSLLTKDLDGILTLIEFLPSFLPLFPAEVLGVLNALIKNGVVSAGKTLSLLCQQVNQEIMHNDSISFLTQAMKFSSLASKVVPQESIIVKPVNIRTLNEDINSTRQALLMNSELIPMMILKVDQLSLLLELHAPKIDENFLLALSLELKQNKSCHDARQIRSFLSYFSFKQPDYYKYDSWIRRDFSNVEYSSKNKIKNPFSRENFELIKKVSFKSNNEIIDAFSFFYPVNLKLNHTELVVSIIKSFKFCPEVADFLLMIVSDCVSECVQFAKDKFWFLKFLFIHGVKYEFPQDTLNEKCIEFGVRNGFIPRSLVINMPELNKEENENGENEYESEIESEITEEASYSIDDVDEAEEWMKIDRLYILLPNEIKSLWSKYMIKQGTILYSRFLPKQAILPHDFLLKLINASSSLPSTLSSSASTSSANISPQSSTTSSSSSFSTLPSSVSLHILEYLLSLASDDSKEAESFFASNENAISAFICRIDIHNPVVFESLFYFVNSLTLMFGNNKKNLFVIKFDELFLKNVFSFDTGFYSACLYEVLPMLKRTFDVFKANGKKLKPSDSYVQFLICLKKGSVLLSSSTEFIPDLE